MNIAVIGLGLIGGSFCKAIKTKTNHTCLGLDISAESVNEALKSGSIDDVISEEELSLADLTIVCLHPKDTISFLEKNAARFKRGSIVIDACGVKCAVINAVSKLYHKNNVQFSGAHPMAGREFSGFAYSVSAAL